MKVNDDKDEAMVEFRDKSKGWWWLGFWVIERNEGQEGWRLGMAILPRPSHFALCGFSPSHNLNGTETGLEILASPHPIPIQLHIDKGYNCNFSYPKFLLFKQTNQY